MIVSNKYKFIFIKTPKTGGSSVEFYLSQFCEKEKDIIQSDTQNINIFKYEKLNKSIYEIKKKLLLKGEKFNLSQINLKKFNFNTEIKLDNNDIIIINESARYFFDNFSYSKEVRDKYL